MAVHTSPSVAIACLVLAVGLDQHLEPAGAAVPFESPRGNLIAVSGTVGPEPLVALLDTGTSRTLLDARLARKLGLRGMPDELDAFGQVLPAERVVLPPLQVGPIHAASLSALAVDLSEVGRRLGWRPDAIIGLDLLRGHCLLIDYETRTLRFSCKEGWTANATCDASSPYLVVPATIDGRNHRLLVDTGSDALAIFERAAPPFATDRAEVVCADTIAGTVCLRRFMAGSVLIGGTQLGSHPILVVPAGDEDLGYDGLLALRQLGSRVQLDLQRLVISWQR